MKTQLLVTHGQRKAVAILGLFVLGLIGTVQSAQALSIQIHITNAGPFVAWNPPEGDELVVYCGESSQSFSPTWSVNPSGTTVVSIDIGSTDPEEITKIDIWGYTWTDETMTEGAPTGGSGGWNGVNGFGSVTIGAE